MQQASHSLNIRFITIRPKMRSHSTSIALLLMLFPIRGVAQQEVARMSDVSVLLPDAPEPQQDGSPGSHAAAAGSVAGIVLDSDGAALVGAQVSLARNDGRQLQNLQSSANGTFTFTEVPIGTYFVTVDASGFAPFQSDEFNITTQELSVTVPEITLAIANLNTNIVVRPTEEIAAEQIKAEEKQRLFAVFPNYYVSYVTNAAPLTSKQKFSLAAHDTFDWTSFVGSTVGAGIEQATNAFKGYGQGAEGYGKRWGAVFVDGRSSDLFSHYIFASLLHQDPRYFYQGTGTRKSRLVHAVSNAFIARSDSGKNMPNYSYLLGDLSAAALSNAYYPDADRGASLVFTNAAIGIAGRAAQAVFEEFFAKRITKHVPQPGSPGGSDPTSVQP